MTAAFPSAFAAMIDAPPETTLTARQLFDALRERVGPGDLRRVLDHVEAIYDAPSDVHWDAADALERAAQDICIDYGVTE